MEMVLKILFTITSEGLEPNAIEKLLRTSNTVKEHLSSVTLKLTEFNLHVKVGAIGYGKAWGNVDRVERSCY